jgi:hypothetical protein
MAYIKPKVTAELSCSVVLYMTVLCKTNTDNKHKGLESPDDLIVWLTCLTHSFYTRPSLQGLTWFECYEITKEKY